MYYFRFSCLILFIVAAAMLFLLRRRCLSFSFRNAFAIFAPSRSRSLCACDSFCFIFSIQLYRHIVYYVYVGIRFFLLATWCKHTLCCVQPSEQVTKYRNNTYIKTNCRNIWKSHINVAPSNNCVSLWAAILCVRGAVHTRARSTHRVWSSNWTTRITYTSAVHTHTHMRVCPLHCMYKKDFTQKRRRRSASICCCYRCRWCCCVCMSIHENYMWSCTSADYGLKRQRLAFRDFQF